MMAWGRRLTDGVQPLLQLDSIQRCQRQTGKDLDAIVQQPKCRSECQPFIDIGALNSGGIGDAPMRGHGLTGPIGTDFAGCVVAHGEDEIEWRAGWRCKLVPRLTPQTLCRKVHLFKQRQCNRVHSPFRMTAGTEATKLAPTPLIDEAFGEDAPSRVTRAKEQYVVDLMHAYFAQQVVAR